MIDEKTITEDIGERAVLVGLITPTQNEAKANEYLAELAFLAETAGAKSEKRFLQRVDNPNPRTFVGKGKLEEITPPAFHIPNVHTVSPRLGNTSGRENANYYSCH